MTSEEIISRKNNLREKAIKQNLGKYKRTEEFLKKIENTLFKKKNVPWNKGLSGESYTSHYKDGIKNQYINHKVKCTRRTGKIVDVYDLTVDKYHNFALGCGIFVHNCLMYKGVEAAKFSTSRSGDYVDRAVAESLNIIPNRVTAFKEKKLDLTTNPSTLPPKDKRILEAIQFYYESMINYSIKKTVVEFQKNIDVDINESIPIIISGGTSMPKGFLQLFRTLLAQYEFPIEISEIRMASNPMTAVANGLLIKTMSDVGK